MIRQCDKNDFDDIHEIINDAARAYRGVIPADCWHEPYMPGEILKKEIERGVSFFGFEDNGTLTGVMGIQDRGDVALIRHAYVRTRLRRKGVGSSLLSFLRVKTKLPVLVGTWRAASWAVSFYAKHGFVPVSEEMKNRLLEKYWVISKRQIETSVVLADNFWHTQMILDKQST
jgi:N-acetylglutamate synthase-like GNAT family acetyltransferase